MQSRHGGKESQKTKTNMQKLCAGKLMQRLTSVVHQVSKTTIRCYLNATAAQDTVKTERLLCGKSQTV